MKKCVIRSFWAVLVLFWITLTIPLSADADDIQSDEKESSGTVYCKVAKDGVTNEAVRVLFVGNSFTGRNDMPAMFQKIASAGGYKTYVEWVYKGGATLCRYADSRTEEGRLFYKKLRKKKWDYVVLQDRSCKALKYPLSLKQSVNKLVRAVKRTGAEPVLYMTWAHKRGAPFYRTSYAKKKRITPSRFYRKTSDFYTELGRSNDIYVAKVGTAFWHCTKYRPRIELYANDKIHPTKEGSYLAACVFYTTIFKEKLPRENLSISPSTAAALRKIAEKTGLT